MSSTVHAEPLPRAHSQPSRRPAAVWVGGVIALIGVVLALSGVAVLAVFGGDDTLSSGPHDLSAPTAAIVSGTAEIDDTTGIADVLGQPRLRLAAEAEGDRDIFVGVGPAEDVDAYLAGIAVTEVTDFDIAPFKLTRHDEPGEGTPAPPVDQPFWLASSTGADRASIDWKVRDGDYRLVVMNADGTLGVDTVSKAGVTLPRMASIAGGAAIAGLIALVAGLAALFVGARRSRPRV